MNILSKITLGIAISLMLIGSSLGVTNTWTGADTLSNVWSRASNWVGNVIPVSGSALMFQGNVGLNNTNDLPATNVYTSIIFSNNAGQFILNGNPIWSPGISAPNIAITNILNSSSTTQTINNNITATGGTYIVFASSLASGDMVFNGTLSDGTGTTTGYKYGAYGAQHFFYGSNAFSSRGFNNARAWIFVTNDTGFGSTTPIWMHNFNSGTSTGGVASDRTVYVNFNRLFAHSGTYGGIWSNSFEGDGFVFGRDGNSIYGSPINIIAPRPTCSVMVFTNRDDSSPSLFQIFSGRIKIAVDNQSSVFRNNTTIAAFSNGSCWIAGSGNSFSNVFRLEGNGGDSNGSVRFSGSSKIYPSVVGYSFIMTNGDASIGIEGNSIVDIYSTNSGSFKLTLGGQGIANSTQGVFNLWGNNTNNLTEIRAIVGATNENALGTNASFMIGNGGTFRALTNNMTITKNIAINADTDGIMGIDCGTNNVAINSIITNGISSAVLYKSGSGTLTINTTNTMTSGLGVTQGRLLLNTGAKFTAISKLVIAGGTCDVSSAASPVIPNTCDVYMYSSGILALNNVTNLVVNRLFVNGVQLPNGTYGREGKAGIDYAFRNVYMPSNGLLQVTGSYTAPNQNKIREPNMLTDPVGQLER